MFVEWRGFSEVFNTGLIWCDGGDLARLGLLGFLVSVVWNLGDGAMTLQQENVIFGIIAVVESRRAGCYGLLLNVGVAVDIMMISQCQL